MVRSFVIYLIFDPTETFIVLLLQENKMCRINKIWIISVACSTVTYKSGEMRTCQNCPDGQESSPDRTVCVVGKFYVEKLITHVSRCEWRKSCSLMCERPTMKWFLNWLNFGLTDRYSTHILTISFL